MAELDGRYRSNDTAARTGVAVDEGLRSHMLGVYNYMTAGIALTGVVAYGLLQFTTTTDPALAVARMSNGTLLTQLGATLYGSPLQYVLMFAPLAFVLFLSFRAHKMSVGAAQIAFWSFAAVMGMSLSSIFLVYTGQSIVQIFFVTAGAFAGLSVWGYTTKKDISGWGSFLIMGVIGIIIASIVNIFILQSSAMQFAISVIGVLVFAGLTAYDTQRIKDNYLVLRDDTAMVAKAAILGALSLYLDFINMFISMLHLFGSSD